MSIESRIDVKAGENPVLQFGPILGTDGMPVDLSGAAITFAISDINRIDVLVKKDNAALGGVNIPDQVTNKGIFNVQWAVLDTEKMSGDYYFEAGFVLNGIDVTCSYGPIGIDRTIIR